MKSVVQHLTILNLNIFMGVVIFWQPRLGLAEEQKKHRPTSGVQINMYGLRKCNFIVHV